jgi:hypothetical protein
VELPPALAEAAIIGPTSELVRRIEIYESDATTRWDGGANDERLIGGSVSIDYSRDERRSVDLTLDNSDFGLEHTPEAFWYDKILKVYCGVKFADTTPKVSYLVRTNHCINPRVGTGTSGWANNPASPGTATAARITGSGCAESDTAYEMTWTTGTSSVSGGGYFFQPASTGAIVPGEPVSGRILARCSKSQRLDMLFYFYDAAGANLTSGRFNTQVVSPGVWTEFKCENVIPPANAARVLIGVYSVTGTGGTTWAIGDKMAYTGVMIEKGEKLKNAFNGATPDFANRDYAWTGTADNSTSTETITITTDQVVESTWEVQVGEFMIDSISEDHFPYTVSVNGRDYTKKCLLSKFATATTFAEGTAIETAIRAMAQNAGITKFLMPPTGHSLGKDYAYERGVPRWEAMKDIASAFGYELFFDAQGYLVMREYLDPVSSPTAYTLATGILEGNLASYSKNVNDNRIYNKIVVTGESSDAAVIPVSAIATNTSPDSPTRIEKLGERVYQYTSAFITTTQQAQDVADKFLQIHALEEFDLSFTAIALPWLEVGEIIEFIDPRPSDGQPTRFLLSSLNLPLSLEAMSGNAKRVSVVG